MAILEQAWPVFAATDVHETADPAWSKQRAQPLFFPVGSKC